MDKYIEWDLENNPQFFTEPHSGKFVNVDVIRHVVCNVNRPDDVPEEMFKRVLNAVAEEVSMIPPSADVVPVVRCRECKKSSCDEKYGNRWCNRNWGCVLVKDDDFCSHGERE